MNDHIMVDLETLSTEMDAAILSVGAVQFDPISGETGHEFSCVIELQTCLDAGARVSADTLYWWLKQSKQARNSLGIEGRLSLQQAVLKWDNFCKEVSRNRKNGSTGNYEVKVWGNGKNFDTVIWRTSHFLSGHKFPVDFWNDRDVRTIMALIPNSLFRQWKEDNPRKGTYHNALDDAKYQVQYMTHFIRELGATEIY